MKKVLAALIALLISSQATAWADAVAGDSIGYGVGVASGLHNVAAVSASINPSSIDRQLARASGTVYLFLGTNNVAGGVPVTNVRKIVDFARGHGIHLVWVGPPCMNKSRFGKYVSRFDAGLGAAVRGAGAAYVSLNAREHCSLARSSDGVHFSGSGYKTVWNMVH